MLAYDQIRAALDGRRLPAALVDLDAVDHNLQVVRETIAPLGLRLRIASKSLRIVKLLERLIERAKGDVSGVMCFSAAEVALLARRGFRDLLLAYPVFRRADVLDLCSAIEQGAIVRAVADSAEGIARLSEVGKERGVAMEVLLCVDMSWRLGGGRLHVGVRRSPLRDPAEVVRLARRVADAPSLCFSGLLGYEAQIAGVPDDGPRRAIAAATRAMKRASLRELSERRRAIVAALCDAGLPPKLVNGGGTGSLADTTAAAGVTETTAGSAFFKPHLFDRYAAPHLRRLVPAAFFALEVTRAPAAGFVTCAGGGYVASGATGADKAPMPWLPAGLSLTRAEMGGEVQTPLRLPRGLALGLGEPVIFRHAKAGELFERFDRALWLRGGRIVDEAPSYRGEGLCFL